MVLPGPNTNYAMKENAIVYNLRAVTFCMIANWNTHHVETHEYQHVFSYAFPGSENELTLLTRPTSRVLLHGVGRFSQLCANLPYSSRTALQ